MKFPAKFFLGPLELPPSPHPTPDRPRLASPRRIRPCFDESLPPSPLVAQNASIIAIIVQIKAKSRMITWGGGVETMRPNRRRYFGGRGPRNFYFMDLVPNQ